ncbi:hypothetical protein [Hyunsoonleella rubra]|uniref:Uncharacterized protein n=1 Tax=Hyunsoonleella rubra TaxID=1737062 RepID=A0ABW5TDH4_9FLAO
MKWYVGTLIIILSVLGVVQHGQSTLPNQEIVLHFKNTESSHANSHATVALVKRELQQAGVSNIQVKENDNGKLKISYYSDADVDVIKRMLSKRIRAELGNTDDDEDAPFSIPVESEATAYNIDVYELQSSGDGDSDVNGIHVLEVEVKADRLFKPKVYSSLTFYKSSKVEDDHSKFKWVNGITLTFDTNLGVIPEVRAGPIS